MACIDVTRYLCCTVFSLSKKFKVRANCCFSTFAWSCYFWTIMGLVETCSFNCWQGWLNFRKSHFQIAINQNFSQEEKWWIGQVFPGQNQSYNEIEPQEDSSIDILNIKQQRRKENNFGSKPLLGIDSIHKLFSVSKTVINLLQIF